MFKVLNVPKKNFKKTGLVTLEIDPQIKRTVISAAGPVSSATKLAIPNLVSAKTFCMHTRFTIIQAAPGLGGGNECNLFTMSLLCATHSGQTIRITLSALAAGEPKVSASSIVLPLRLTRWATVCLDIPSIFMQAYGGAVSFKGVVQFEATATSCIRGVYFTDKETTPYTAVEALYLPPPHTLLQRNPNIMKESPLPPLIRFYAWVTVGIPPTDALLGRTGLGTSHVRDKFSSLRPIAWVPEDFSEYPACMKGVLRQITASSAGIPFSTGDVTLTEREQQRQRLASSRFLDARERQKTALQLVTHHVDLLATDDPVPIGRLLADEVSPARSRSAIDYKNVESNNLSNYKQHITQRAPSPPKELPRPQRKAASARVTSKQGGSTKREALQKNRSSKQRSTSPVAFRSVNASVHHCAPDDPQAPTSAPPTAELYPLCSPNAASASKPAESSVQYHGSSPQHLPLVTQADTLTVQSTTIPDQSGTDEHKEEMAGPFISHAHKRLFENINTQGISSQVAIDHIPLRFLSRVSALEFNRSFGFETRNRIFYERNSNSCLDNSNIEGIERFLIDGSAAECEVAAVKVLNTALRLPIFDVVRIATKRQSAENAENVAGKSDMAPVRTTIISTLCNIVITGMNSLCPVFSEGAPIFVTNAGSAAVVQFMNTSGIGGIAGASLDSLHQHEDSYAESVFSISREFAVFCLKAWFLNDKFRKSRPYQSVPRYSAVRYPAQPLCNPSADNSTRIAAWLDSIETPPVIQKKDRGNGHIASSSLDSSTLSLCAVNALLHQKVIANSTSSVLHIAASKSLPLIAVFFTDFLGLFDVQESLRCCRLRGIAFYDTIPNFPHYVECTAFSEDGTKLVAAGTTTTKTSIMVVAFDLLDILAAPAGVLSMNKFLHADALQSSQIHEPVFKVLFLHGETDRFLTVSATQIFMWRLKKSVSGDICTLRCMSIRLLHSNVSETLFVNVREFVHTFISTTLIRNAQMSPLFLGAIDRLVRQYCAIRYTDCSITMENSVILSTTCGLIMVASLSDLISPTSSATDVRSFLPDTDDYRPILCLGFCTDRADACPAIPITGNSQQEDLEDDRTPTEPNSFDSQENSLGIEESPLEVAAPVSYTFASSANCYARAWKSNLQILSLQTRFKDPVVFTCNMLLRSVIPGGADPLQLRAGRRSDCEPRIEVQAITENPSQYIRRLGFSSNINYDSKQNSLFDESERERAQHTSSDEHDSYTGESRISDKRIEAAVADFDDIKRAESAQILHASGQAAYSPNIEDRGTTAGVSQATSSILQRAIRMTGSNFVILSANGDVGLLAFHAARTPSYQLMMFTQFSNVLCACYDPLHAEIAVLTNTRIIIYDSLTGVRRVFFKLDSSTRDALLQDVFRKSQATTPLASAIGMCVYHPKDYMLAILTTTRKILILDLSELNLVCSISLDGIAASVGDASSSILQQAGSRHDLVFTPSGSHLFVSVERYIYSMNIRGNMSLRHVQTNRRAIVKLVASSVRTGGQVSKDVLCALNTAGEIFVSTVENILVGSAFKFMPLSDNQRLSKEMAAASFSAAYSRDVINMHLKHRSRKALNIGKNDLEQRLLVVVCDLYEYTEVSDESINQASMKAQSGLSQLPGDVRSAMDPSALLASSVTNVQTDVILHRRNKVPKDLCKDYASSDLYTPKYPDIQGLALCVYSLHGYSLNSGTIVYDIPFHAEHMTLSKEPLTALPPLFNSDNGSVLVSLRTDSYGTKTSQCPCTLIFSLPLSILEISLKQVAGPQDEPANITRDTQKPLVHIDGSAFALDASVLMRPLETCTHNAGISSDSSAPHTLNCFGVTDRLCQEILLRTRVALLPGAVRSIDVDAKNSTVLTCGYGANTVSQFKWNASEFIPDEYAGEPGEKGLSLTDMQLAEGRYMQACRSLMTQRRVDQQAAASRSYFREGLSNELLSSDANNVTVEAPRVAADEQNCIL